jgi:hypothetical protein
MRAIHDFAIGAKRIMTSRFPYDECDRDSPDASDRDLFDASDRDSLDASDHDSRSHESRSHESGPTRTKMHQHRYGNREVMIRFAPIAKP